MLFTVYILFSEKTKKHYIGYTSDLTKRIKRHNSGRNRSTKNGRPWYIVYTEAYETKNDAYKRERQIKKMKGGVQFRDLLSKQGSVA